jgi:hypothetical protein
MRGINAGQPAGIYVAFAICTPYAQRTTSSAALRVQARCPSLSGVLGDNAEWDAAPPVISELELVLTYPNLLASDGLTLLGINLGYASVVR